MLVVIACSPKVYIATPEITINNTAPLVFDEITIQVEEQVNVDGNNFEIEKYEWYIEDLEGTIIKQDFLDTALITWTPLKAGLFVIRVDIIYNESERITSYKEIQVWESPKSLQYLLAGEWEGHAFGSIIGEWDLVIRFDSSGICSGEVNNDYGAEECIFIFGQSSSNPDRNDCSDVGDHGCQGIFINGVTDNVGYGRISMLNSFYYMHEIVWECFDSYYYLDKLRIDRTTNELYMKLVASDGDIDYIEYNLTRKK